MEDWVEWENFCKKNDIKISSYEDIEDGKIYYSDRVYDTPYDVISIMGKRDDLFCKYVGTHCNYDENGNRGKLNLNPYSDHDKFYKSDIEKPNIRRDEWKMLGKFVYPF